MKATKCYMPFFKECDQGKSDYKKYSLDDDHGSSKEILHFNAYKMRKLRVVLKKENFFKQKIIEMMRITCKIILKIRFKYKQK